MRCWPKNPTSIATGSGNTSRATTAAAPAITRSSMRSRRWPRKEPSNGGAPMSADDLVSAREIDRPNSYVGRTVPRPNARRLLHGKGVFVDDMVLPRMLHVAFVRSPHAHARIRAIDSRAAAQSPGVVRIVTGAEMATHVTPWVATLSHLKGMKSAPQLPLPVEVATWQGEAVVAVVAHSRAEAEDAVALVEVDWE